MWASAIFELDGNLDIVKTHFADDTAVLYVNNGKGEFRDVHAAVRPGRRNPLCQLGHRDRGSRQRRQSRYFLGHRRHLSRRSKQAANYQERRGLYSAILGKGSLKNCSARPGRASKLRIPAAAARLATSITTATWTS